MFLFTELKLSHVLMQYKKCFSIKTLIRFCGNKTLMQQTVQFNVDIYKPNARNISTP
jgi:hypothetical protein